MMTVLKRKLINWSHNRLSLAERILVANRVVLASMWYIAACWNPNPWMTTQIRGVIRNFIWGGKDAPTCAKVKWDILTLPTTQGRLGIIDPKAQSEALLAKLLIKGLAPGGEPWKELIRHKANQIWLPVHNKGPNTPDVNWIFAALKVKRIPCLIWKSIIGARMKVDALPSPRVNPLEGSPKCSCGKLRFGRCSRLPTLERNRGSSWEPRD